MKNKTVKALAILLAATTVSMMGGVGVMASDDTAAEATEEAAADDAAEADDSAETSDDQAAADKYMDLFCEKTGTAKRYVQQWLPLVAAAQLTKKRPEEQELHQSWLNVCDYQ